MWLFWTAKRLYATIASGTGGVKTDQFFFNAFDIDICRCESLDAGVERRRQPPEPPRIARKVVAIRSMEKQ